MDCGCHLGIFVAGLWIKNPRESPQSWGRHVPANRVPRTEYLPRDPRTMDVTRQGAKRQSPREGNGITHGLGGVPGPIVRARPTDYGGNSLNLFLFLFQLLSWGNRRRPILLDRRHAGEGLSGKHPDYCRGVIIILFFLQVVRGVATRTRRCV